MIISHSNRYIFVKSQKTAGTSIEAALSRYCADNDMVTPLGDYWFNRDEKGEWIHSSMNAEGFSQHDPAAEVKRKVPPKSGTTIISSALPETHGTASSPILPGKRGTGRS